jgi:hypothetical protein
MKKTIRKIEISLERTSSVRLTKLSETHDATTVADEDQSSYQDVRQLDKPNEKIEVKDEKNI